jgi:PA14 domain
MKRACVVASVLLATACSFQMQARSSGAGSGAGVSEQRKPQSRGKGKKWSASFHESGSVHGELHWQGRSGRLCRAVSPLKFVGTAKLAGNAQLKDGKVTASGTGQASGKSTGGERDGSCDAPRTPVPTTPPAKPVTHPQKPETDVPPRTKPKPGDLGKAPPKNPQPVKEQPQAPAGPTPEELEKPVDPPKAPPDNVFGYEKPVLGCFEGQVFPLAQDAPALPTDYASLTPVSAVYACEWDISPRQWDQGFPGIADRFEWFAIRYAGAFRVAEAGEYSFRLSSDDGSKLTVDGRVVIDNDKQHPPQALSGKVQLAAGDHQMVLEYFQGPRFEINLQLWVSPPGKPEELFTVR